jgi:peptide-methionine (S)-S-oxide reductase
MKVTPEDIKQYDESAPTPAETETATFALGCFWGPDARFGSLDGVIRTRVGYAGGTTADPTYHSLGDHTEAVQLEYDPSEVTYTALLMLALESHDPHRQPSKRQYQNIFFPTPSQKETVNTVLDSNGFDLDSVATRIRSPPSPFYHAEDYHQKYHLRSKRWAIEAFDNAGYDEDALRESPTAAILNATAAGHDTHMTESIADTPHQ